MKHVHILGAGAMGCLWASYFSNDTTSLHFIVKPASDWLNSKAPLVYQPEDRQIQIQPASKNQLSKGSIEHLIIATKAQHTLTSLLELKDYLNPNCEILLLQNGMGSQQEVAAAFSSHAVYACSSTEGAYKVDSHTIFHAGKGENQIGAMNALGQLSKLQNWLPEACFSWHEDIRPVLWRKLVINAAINPLTVQYHCQNGKLLESSEALNHMKRVCGELQLLVAAENLELGDLFALAKSVCQSTAQNFSSMYKDHEAGRQTEIEYINGYIVRAAEKLDILCPENRKLVEYFS